MVRKRSGRPRDGSAARNCFEDTGGLCHYVELRYATIRLRIEETGNPGNVIDKTLDRITDLDPRRPAPSTRGRIGLRHMTGTSVIYRNFQVRQL
jgi:hypothetical protein